MRMKRLMIYLAACLCCLTMAAQKFGVARFRVMPNDISAYIHPMRDLNGEACALIKVVGSKDFAFSTPLGIVKRVDEVGEVWLYVPHGTRLLTVKHPRWGVLRDYCLDPAAESRLTYELVLAEPLPDADGWGVPFPEMHPVAVWRVASDIPQPEPVSWKARRAKEPWRMVALVGTGISDGVSAGLRLGVMRRHGAYVYGQTNFTSLPSTVGTCDDEGYTADGSLPYYTGRTEDARWLLTAGAMHRLFGTFYLYEGLGYGKRTLVWQTIEDTYLRHAPRSVEGLSAELGAMYRWRMLMLSAGVTTIAADWWEMNVGIGISF